MGSSIPENSLVFARAVLADYRATLATAPVSTPPGREWMFKLAEALADVLDDDQADEADQADDEDEPYCYTCGSPIGIFLGHGDGWHHWRGQGTADSPVELYDAGHAPEVAWRPAGAR
jgi:hypothetical protein